MNLYSTGMAHCVKVYSNGAENLFFSLPVGGVGGGWVLVLVEILEFVKRDKSLKYGLVLLGRGVWGSSPRNFWKLRREMVHSGPLWAKNIGNTLINNQKKIQQKKVSLKKGGVGWKDMASLPSPYICPCCFSLHFLWILSASRFTVYNTFFLHFTFYNKNILSPLFV